MHDDFEDAIRVTTRVRGGCVGCEELAAVIRLEGMLSNLRFDLRAIMEKL